MIETFNTSIIPRKLLLPPLPHLPFLSLHPLVFPHHHPFFLNLPSCEIESRGVAGAGAVAVTRFESLEVFVVSTSIYLLIRRRCILDVIFSPCDTCISKSDIVPTEVLFRVPSWGGGSGMAVRHVQYDMPHVT